MRRTFHMTGMKLLFLVKDTAYVCWGIGTLALGRQSLTSCPVEELNVVAGPEGVRYASPASCKTDAWSHLYPRLGLPRASATPRVFTATLFIVIFSPVVCEMVL